jgi:hypothetical protein
MYLKYNIRPYGNASHALTEGLRAAGKTAHHGHPNWLLLGNFPEKFRNVSPVTLTASVV